MQLNQLDMKKIMFLLDENEHRTPYLPQPRQEMGTNNWYPCHATDHDQEVQQGGFFNNYVMPNGNGSASASAETSNDEDILWDGLWNLDDFHANFAGTCATSKAKAPKAGALDLMQMGVKFGL
ncbi:hypothetical protein JRO89_XS03G0078400 [Xanthoceras sorbifolium]|uniref:Uncharacterized protein n=1 Tax=Xanthoceras sorbifolium TaxID=99658 RepID=A0ABQ8I958_9ROSI|nr:hypothetical protein JRO89_XS03G0078400 [Xanthoceras sorbifolium]